MFTEKTRFIGKLCGSVEALLLHEINVVNFCVTNLYIIFCKTIVKDAVKQTIWFLACWFFKHNIWTGYEKLCLNVIFVSISVVFHSSLVFLTLISFVFMDLRKFSNFFHVVVLSTFVDDKFFLNTQESKILCC